MTDYKRMRIETYTVTKIIKFKDLSLDEQIEISSHRLKKGDLVRTVIVGDKAYNDFDLDIDEVWTLERVDETGVER